MMTILNNALLYTSNFLTRLVLILIPQNICILKHNVAYLEYENFICQSYPNKARKKREKEDKARLETVKKVTH